MVNLSKVDRLCNSKQNCKQNMVISFQKYINVIDNVSDAKAVWSDLDSFARHCFAGCLRLANVVAEDYFLGDFDEDFQGDSDDNDEVKFLQ